MQLITKDTIVVNTPPRINNIRFAEVLLSNVSPATGDAFAMFDAIVAEGIDPAFALAFFRHESQFGKVGVCHDYDTHSPGNTRSSRIGVNTFVTVPGKGQYVKYSDWYTGMRDACHRLSDPSFVYAQKGAVTIGQILPIWAPASDGNSPDVYIQAVCDSMNQWIEQGSSSTSTMEIIDLSNNTPASVYTDRGLPISELVLHDTSGSGDFNYKSSTELQALLDATIRWFQGGGGLSIHYLIGPEALGGKIYRLCKEQYAAYHVIGDKGPFTFNGIEISKDNRISIGIERFGQPNEAVGPNQRNAMLWLVSDICQRNNLAANQIVSHMSIQSDRRDGGVLLGAARQVVINGGISKVTTEDTKPILPADNRINGHTVAGGFGAFYDKLTAISPNFQLLVLGLPVTDEFDCDVDNNGKSYTVQLFERSALLYEKINAAPWDIHAVTTAQLENVLAAAKGKGLV